MNIPYKSIYHEHNMLIVDNNIFMSIFSNGNESNKLQGQVFDYLCMDEGTKYNEGTLEFNKLSINLIFDAYNRLLRNGFTPTYICVPETFYNEIIADSGIYFSGTFEDLY